jgi:thiol-disulfide isomerase/thioredoxin
MKNAVRFTAIVSLLLTFSASQAAANPPDDRWLYGAAGYARALELQRETNGPLVVYFYTDWCPYCHALDNEYLPSAPVQEYLRNAVKVRINPEDDSANREIARQYGVRGYPAFFVIAGPNTFPQSVSPFYKRGNLSPAEFAEKCREVSRGVNLVRPTARVPKQDAGYVTSKGGMMVQVKPSANAAPSLITNAPLPAVEQVIARYVEATGGATAQSRVTSRVVKGKVDVAGLSFGGRFEVYTSGAAKSLAVVDVEPIGLIKHCLDGQNVWFHAANSSQDMKTPELAVLAAADLYREGKLENMYARLKLAGKQKEGYREVYVVEAGPRTGPADMLYFDAESGLLIHRDLTRQTSRGPITSQIYFGDWRKVDGVMLPFRLTQSIAGRTFVITLDEIKQNVGVAAEIFQRPTK